MKIKIYGWMIGLVSCIILSACTDEIPVKQSIVGDKEVLATLNFGIVGHDKIEISSRSTYDLHYESMVRNLYVFLFANGERIYGKFFGADLRNQPHAEEYWIIDNMSSDRTISKTTGSIQMKVPTVSSNAEIVIVANIDLDFLNLSEERLGLVRTKNDLTKMLLTLNQERPERNAGYFMMTGVQDGISISEEGVVSLPTGVTSIPLKRLDAKIEVNVRVDSDETSTTQEGTEIQQVEEFVPESWEVVNMPKSCYLLLNEADPSQGEEGYFHWEPMNFETTENEVGTDGQETGAVLHGFSFYMLENRESTSKKESTGGNYHLRDMRSKHTDDIHADNYGTYDEDAPMWKYAPEYATYIVIKGELKMVVNPGSTSEQHLTADVTYHVHLGDFDTDADDYDIFRNTNYKYTLTIKGVNNIKVEVETSNDKVAGVTESQPGASGHLYTAESDLYTFDAHYGQRVYSLYAKDIDVDNMTWYIRTPFGREGVPAIDPISLKENYDNMDFEWVEFMLNELASDGSGKYSEGNQKYPDSDNKGKLMNVIEFVDLLKTETTKWKNSQTSLFDEDGKINVTVFVNEFYYEKHPFNENSTDVLWKSFVNQPNRLMHILCKSQHSKDGDSSETSSILTIRQRSIQTPFNINPEKTDLTTGWGCETEDEMRNQAWFYSPAETKDSGTNYKITSYAPQNTSRTDGLYNTACLLNLVNENLSWETFLDYSGEEVQLKGEYKAGLYSVLLRNRDLDGDGTIDANELRWYIASLDQLCGLFLGDQGLHGDAQLYPIATSREPNVAINDPSNPFNGVYPWRLHVVSSTAWRQEAGAVPTIVWAEEGASTGDYQQHHGKPGYSPVKCVRNLGMADATESNIRTEGSNYPKDNLVIVTEPTGTISTSSVYKFNFTNMNEESRRYYTSHELAPGDEYSVMSRLYDGFETGALYNYGSNYSNALKAALENGYSPSTANAAYAGYRVPNLREGVVMYLYCNSSWFNGASFMVSNYYSFGNYGNNYDVTKDENGNDEYYYSWSIFNDRVTVGDQNCKNIRFVKDWNP